MSEILHKYRPRPAFLAFHSRSQRWSVLVCHRRAGKTVCAINDLVIRALRTQKPDAFYAYIAPYYGQAKQASWTYLKNAVGNIPGIKISESELTVTLPNKARVRVFGADNPDALRGLYFDGLILDEFGDMAGRVWTEVIRPALADRRGWAVFLGTPRGKNKFYDMAQKARSDPEWFFLELKASQSGIIPRSELDALTADMEPEEIMQEFECSFEASVKGSFFGKHISRLQELGALKTGPKSSLYDSKYPVSCSHDPGRDDAWAIWFWQVIDGEVRFIDYWCETGYDAEEVAEVLALKPYTYETWWLPHDAVHRTAQSKKSILDIFREQGAPARRVPNPDAGNGILHGINAVRKVLRTYRVVFDAERCKDGLEALRNYSRKWNADSKVFSETPKHDEWSHGADSFRYACLSISPESIAKSSEQSKKRVHNSDGSVTVTQTVVTYTLKQAFDDYDQQMARQWSGERQRI